MRRGLTTVSALAFTLGAVCVASVLRWFDRPVATVASAVSVVEPEPYAWDIPAPFHARRCRLTIPCRRPKVDLGAHLFHDARLSANRRLSCAACHTQSLGFADGRGRAIGSLGDVHPRGSMSLANVAYNPAYNWRIPTPPRSRRRCWCHSSARRPWSWGMPRMVRNCWPGSARMPAIGRCLPAHFRRIRRRSAWPMWRVRWPRFSGHSFRCGHRTIGIAMVVIAMPSPTRPSVVVIFFSGQRGGCFQCHGGWNFSGGIRHERDTTTQAAFFNTGLYNLTGPSSYPALNTGLHAITKRAEDVGRFRAPTLRNIAMTAPYMHDGSIETLEEVIDHYAAGGRTLTQGPNAGVGRNNPNKAPSVHGFTLSGTDRQDLVAFLESLTDTTFLTSPAFSSPWRRAR